MVEQEMQIASAGTAVTAPERFFGRRPVARAIAAASFGGLVVFRGVQPVYSATDPMPQVSPEVPVTATNIGAPASNNSPLVLADPTQPQFLVTAHRLDSPTFNCGLQVSGDGGRGWVGAKPVPTLPPGAETCYAAEAAFDRKGTLYYLFAGLHGLGNQPIGVFLTSSTDHAQNFSVPRLVLGPENYMVRMAIDPTVGSRGRIHLVWVHAADSAGNGFPGGLSNPILSSYSDDGGATFSAPVQVSDSDRQRVVAPSLTLGPDHAVHIAYYDLRDDAVDYLGVEGPAWDGRWSLVVSSSTDGGRHFGPGRVLSDELKPTGRVMLIFTTPGPSLAADHSGRVYVAWPDSRNGDPDVFLSRSSDAGSTWTQPQRLNDDAPGVATDQYLPRLGVAPNGRVDAIFLDRRNDPANLRNDVYYTYSTDHGMSFTPSMRLTTKVSDSRIGQKYLNPSAEGLVEFGSRLGLLSRDSGPLAAWPDTRNSPSVGIQEQDLFSVQVTLPGQEDAASPTGSDSSWPVVILAGVVALALAVVGAIVWRRRHPNLVVRDGAEGPVES